MLDMATRKSPRPSRQRRGKSLNCYINGDLRDALDLAVEKSRPRSNVTSIVEVALEEFLEKLDLWPPSPKTVGDD